LQRLVQALREIQIARGVYPWLLLDLTMVQLKTLLLVVQSGGLRSRELADGLGVAPSAVTPLVDRLVEQKLLRREDDPDDRRVVRIRATRRAAALYGKLMEANQDVLGEVLAELPAAERPGVQAALDRLIGAADRVLARPLKTRS
jgi:DNA-binding MarR family transcriptional regulator